MAASALERGPQCVDTDPLAWGSRPRHGNGSHDSVSGALWMSTGFDCGYRYGCALNDGRDVLDSEGAGSGRPGVVPFVGVTMNDQDG